MLRTKGSQICFYYHLFLQFILRDLLKHVSRSMITVSGIALGVAVFVAISLANSSVLSCFKDTVDKVAGRANLVISPAMVPYIDDSILESLSWLWSEQVKFTPVLQGMVLIPGRQDEVVQLVGVDMFCDPAFKNYASGDEKTKDEQNYQGSDLSFLSQRAVYLGSKLAGAYGLKPGDQLQVLSGGRAQLLHVAGVLSGLGLGGAYSGNIIVCDLSNAQRILCLPGKLSRISLIVPEEDVVTVKLHLEEQLPASLIVERPEERTAQVAKMTRSFQDNLLALAFVAIMVGMFLIYNTMSITVLRRRKEIGILRALGMAKHQIFSLFALESVAFGMVGSILGCGLGILLSSYALAGVSSTVRFFYCAEAASELTINWTIVFMSCLTGTALSFIASLPPLFESMSVPPSQAIRSADHQDNAHQKAPRLAACGVIFCLLACLSALQPPLAGFPVFGYQAALFFVLSMAFFQPLLLRYLLPALATFLGRSCPEGKLALLTLYGALGRTAIAAASLAIGVAMMVSLAILIGSFRQTLTVWIDQTLKADLWVESIERAGGNANSRLNATIVDALGALPQVAGLDGFVETPVFLNGERTNLAGADFPVIKRFGHIHYKSGASNGKVAERMNEETAIISETFALHHNLNEGDSIQIPSPKGYLKLRIVGVYYDYASDLGYIIIERSLFQRAFSDSSVSSCAIYLKPGSRADDLVREIAQLKLPLVVRSSLELKRQAMKIFDRTFAITYALHTIAIAVALLSVVNALLAITLESQREFGILRYLGMSREQLRRLVITQGTTMAVFGVADGVVLGYILSLVLIYVVNRQSFGWTITMAAPVEFIAESCMLVIATAAVASIYPASIAARTPAPEVVRNE